MTSTAPSTKRLESSTPSETAIRWDDAKVATWKAEILTVVGVKDWNAFERNAKLVLVSFEPLIGSVRGCDLHDIHWAIVGGESGPRARRMEPEWVDEMEQLIAEGRRPPSPPVVFSDEPPSQENA